MRNLINLSKKQIACVTAVSAFLVVLAVSLDLLLKAGIIGPGQGNETATASEASVSAATASAAYRYSGISSKLTDIVEETPYKPSPDVLNLAYYYPEDADTSDVINSYAGRLYTELTSLEAQYMANIYDLSDRTPRSMANELGLPSSRYIGKYNPTDSSHDPDNPATWTVNSFKNTNVAFYDGDGNRINAYSVVKEIMSLASVYSYYHGMYDYESMRDYALKLWESSHSYTISMGNVYYDSGCLHKTIQQESEEAVRQEEEQQLLEESLAKRTAASSGDKTIVYTLPETDGPANHMEEETLQEALPFIDVEAGVDALSSDENAKDASEEQEGTLSPFIPTGDQEQTSYDINASNAVYGAETGIVSADGEALPDGEAEANLSEVSGDSSAEEQNHAANDEGSSSEPINSDSSGAETQLNSSERQVETTQAASQPAVNAGETESAQPQSSAASAAEQAAGEPVGATFADLTGLSLGTGTAGLSYRGVKLAAEDDDIQATLFGGTEESVSAAAAEEESETESRSENESAFETTAGISSDTQSGSGTSTVSFTAESDEDTAIEATLADAAHTSRTQETVTESYCPGHIDLYITVTIRGIEDVNGLIRQDEIGSDPSNFTEDWQGWTDEMKAYADDLNAEDWFTRYGLTISAINVRNPLTEGEINDYLSRIPDSVSDIRKEIVSFALHSVGKVPYYWGGKPSAAQYEGNRFGTIVSPDAKGRVLRGLDCSGWINWVYWSVTGSRLAGESTGTLIGCGERISRAELQPGDIIVRTGADAHVVMFLEWSDDGSGNMIVVHETGGITNNVTVSEVTANWPYYRRLIP